MITRQYLRENQAALNLEDKAVLARLFALAECMHRRIVDNGQHYVFCRRAATRNSGPILFCRSHREQ